MNKRLRELRKEILNLTLKEFGNKIGLSSSGLGDIENSRCNLTASNIKLICQTFNVNEEWLKQGLEPIFKENTEKNFLEELKEKYNIQPILLDLLKNYISLDEDDKKIFDNYLKKIVGVEKYNEAEQHAKENIKQFKSLNKLQDNNQEQLEKPKEKVKIIARGEGITYIDKEELDEIKRNSTVLSDEDFHKYF